MIAMDKRELIALAIPAGSCRMCGDTGWILSRDTEGNDYCRPCQCASIKATKKRLETGGIARTFREKTFDNFHTMNRPVLEDAKETAFRYWKHFSQIRGTGNNSLMLCGQVGAGKTHLGTACSMELISQGIGVLYMEYREEMTALKAQIRDEERYSAVMQRYKTAEVLFVDDFLKGKITESDVNIVYEIVNYRYNNNLPIILSTEKSLDGLINFDEAIGSRLIEMSRGHIVVFEGKELNYRLYGGGVA